MKIELGDKVKDTITGLTGIVICVSEWLHGCKRICVQPQGTHEGKMIDSFVIDEPQCTVVTKAVIKKAVTPKHGNRDDRKALQRH